MLYAAETGIVVCLAAAGVVMIGKGSLEGSGGGEVGWFGGASVESG